MATERDTSPERLQEIREDLAGCDDTDVLDESTEVIRDLVAMLEHSTTTFGWRWLEPEVLHVLLMGGRGREPRILAAYPVHIDSVVHLLFLVEEHLYNKEVPFHRFKATAGLVPVFDEPQPIDYGSALSLGTYEAAADVIWDHLQ